MGLGELGGSLSNLNHPQKLYYHTVFLHINFITPTTL